MANITESLKDLQLTKEEVEKFGDALKNKEFRKMLIDYVEEVQSPENQRIYEQEIIELEKQRGVDVTFVKPSAGYVIKTSADGEKKVFINICSNDLIKKPTSNPSFEGGSKGYQWQVPHSLTPPRDDVDKQGKLCKVYDFVCHPSALELAQKTKTFRDMLNNMACETIESNFYVKLDRKNLKFPKMQYKGRPYSAVMRKPCSNSSSVNPEDREFMDKLFSDGGCPYKPPSAETQPKTINIPNNNSKNESKYTIPKYNIKHRSHIELEQFAEHKTAKMNSAIPKELVVEIILPLLKSASDVVLDVNDKSLHIKSEKPAKYKLDLNLPYEVIESLGNAKFEKDKKKLIVTLPVKRNSGVTFAEIGREDSGIESDHASFVSSSPTEENERLVTEMNDGIQVSDSERTNDDLSKETPLENVFLDPNYSYLLPDFNVHFFDDAFAFTLNVKNVTHSSLFKTFENDLQSVHLKFTSVSSGFFPLHYAFYFRAIDATIDFKTIVTEVWDNNVEVQIPVKSCDKYIESFLVGIDSNNLTKHYLHNNASSTSKFFDQERNIDVPTNSKPPLLMSTDQSEDESTGDKIRKEKKKNKSKGKQSNWKNQKNQRQMDDDDDDDDDDDGNTTSKGINIAGFCESSGDELSYSYSPHNKGILKNLVRRSFSRSMSESSIDEAVFTSSVENCHSIDSAIPEEQHQVSTSLKKTVRFNDVVSKQVFRSNSSILGQRRKNQRKAKAKKRAQERKYSESELSENDEKKEENGSNGNESSSEGTGLSENENNSSDRSDKNEKDSNEFNNDIFLMDIDF